MKRYTHTLFSRGESVCAEHRRIWKTARGPEKPAENGEGAEEQRAEEGERAAEVAAAKRQGGIRKKIGALLTPQPADHSQPDMWTKLYEGPEVDAPEAAKETLAAGAVGTTAAALAKIGTVAGLPQAALTGGSGYVGWNLGKRYLGRHFPDAAGPIGAVAGVALAPAVPALVQGTGHFLSGIGASGITSVATAGAALGGGGFGFYLANKIPIPHAPTKLAVNIGGGIVGASLGSYGASFLTPALQPLLPVLKGLGGYLTTFGTSITGYFPALATTTGALSSSLGVGGTVAALYAMGWANGRLNGYGNTGFLGNLWRGLTLIPYGLPKYGLNRGITATRNAITGNNKYVKALTSPIWWPIRTALRPVLGLGEGLYTGVTGSPAADRYHARGVMGKVGRGIGSAVTSPVWGGKKLWKHLMAPASSAAKGAH